MIKPTQEMMDADIATFKSIIIEKCNGKDLGVALALDKQLMQKIAEYELDIRPMILSLNLTAPTLAELFGIDITVTEKPSQETISANNENK